MSRWDRGQQRHTHMKKKKEGKKCQEERGEKKEVEQQVNTPMSIFIHLVLLALLRNENSVTGDKFNIFKTSRLTDVYFTFIEGVLSMSVQGLCAFWLLGNRVVCVFCINNIMKIEAGEGTNTILGMFHSITSNNKWLKSS